MLDWNVIAGMSTSTTLRSSIHPISYDEWKKLKICLEKMNFWQLPSSIKDGGADGARWMLEAKAKENYHMAQRWSPEGDDFKDACLYLLKLSGLDKTEKDVY